MSQENVEVVQSIYEAFNRRDWDAAFRNADPNFEFMLKRSQPGVHRGRQEVQGVIEDQAAAFDLWTVEPEELFDNDDQVVAFVKFRLRPKGSAAEFEISIGTLWTFRDGRAISAEGFPERHEALEAAGLSDADRSLP
jgi:ketosteroid isomerase-like protein